MDKDKYLDREDAVSSQEQIDMCYTLIECHRAYHEVVTEAGMAYEDFIANFFGFHKSLGVACQMFREHQPIIEHRFKSSAFGEDDALAMLKEFDHCNSFFDRSLIDIQLKPIKAKLEKEGIISLLLECVNSIVLFHQTMEYTDLMAVLTGASKKDYGIYNVSYFAYFMKKLENQAMMIQHWQSMVWNLSRIVYKGKYLNQHLISCTIHNLGFLKRRPWYYNEIDEFLLLLKDKQ